MNILNHDNQAILTLVENCKFCEKRPCLFVTISPNPSTVLKLKMTKRMNKPIERYKNVPYKVQQAYIEKVIITCYLELLPKEVKLVGCYEFNKTGQLHAHLLIQTDFIKNDIDLTVFRRDIMNCELVMNNRKKDNNDYMNNIVFVNDSIAERVKYMMKTGKDMLKYFPNIYYNGTENIQTEESEKKDNPEVSINTKTSEDV